MVRSTHTNNLSQFFPRMRVELIVAHGQHGTINIVQRKRSGSLGLPRIYFGRHDFGFVVSRVARHHEAGARQQDYRRSQKDRVKQTRVERYCTGRVLCPKMGFCLFSRFHPKGIGRAWMNHLPVGERVTFDSVAHGSTSALVDQNWGSGAGAWNK